MKRSGKFGSKTNQTSYSEHLRRGRSAGCTYDMKQLGFRNIMSKVDVPRLLPRLCNIFKRGLCKKLQGQRIALQHFKLRGPAEQCTAHGSTQPGRGSTYARQRQSEVLGPDGRLHRQAATPKAVKQLFDVESLCALHQQEQSRPSRTAGLRGAFGIVCPAHHPRTPGKQKGNKKEEKI